MSTHGNKDFLALTDTYYILDTVVGQEGTDDDLSVLVNPGDSIVLNGTEYVVEAVIGATGLTLTSEHGSTGPITGATGYIQQKPKVLSLTERATVYGVDATEMGATGIGAGHAGWVKVTTGSGGRSGRTQYETLTVLSDNSKATMGDAEDTEFTV